MRCSSRRVLFALSVTFYTCGCATRPAGDHAAPEARAAASAEAVVARRYVESYGRGDIDAMAASMASDIVMSDPTGAILGAAMRVVGRDAVVATLKPMFAAVSDKQMLIERWFVSGQHGVFWVRYRYAAPAPSGAVVPVDLDAVIVLQLDGGEVARHTDYADYASVLRELGGR